VFENVKLCMEFIVYYVVLGSW